MRILVFSDSHGRVSPMIDAVERYRPDLAFHLGDMVRDGENLRLACPRLKLFQVRGNCDWGCEPSYELEGMAQLEGKGVFYLHGHTRQVKLGPSPAMLAARSAGADILLFGHTHCPLELRQDGLLAVNPGAVQDGLCALLTWEAGGEVTCVPLRPGEK